MIRRRVVGFEDVTPRRSQKFARHVRFPQQAASRRSLSSIDLHRIPLKSKKNQSEETPKESLS